MELFLKSREKKKKIKKKSRIRKNKITTIIAKTARKGINITKKCPNIPSSSPIATNLIFHLVSTNSR